MSSTEENVCGSAADGVAGTEARPADAFPAAAIENLRNSQQQLDMDGIIVGVSRQAIEEVLAYVEATRLCEDCPPTGYPTDKTRCAPCPRRAADPVRGELAEALTLLCEEIEAGELHGGGADDEGCPTCQAIKRARAALTKAGV